MKFRSRRAVAAFSTAALAVPGGIAMADYLSVDADTVTPDVQGTRSLGTVQPGALVAGDAAFRVTCSGTSKHLRGATVTVAYDAADSTAPAGGAILGAAGTPGTTPSTATINVPGGSAWPAHDAACATPAQVATSSVNSQFKLKAPLASGSHSFTLGYEATGSYNADAFPTTQRAGTATYTLSVANVAPSVRALQGATEAVAGDTASFSFSASDANGTTPSKSLEVVSEPQSGAAQVSGLDVTFTKAGTYSIKGVATDAVDGSLVTKTAAHEVVVASANEPPTAPGAPATTDNPNAGAFTLTWDASTDADDDAIAYTLEHRRSDQLAWTEVASGLTQAEHAFAGDDTESEGSWTYRVRASDGTEDSADSDPSDTIVVDRSAPAAPTASADRAPEYEDGSAQWFKDSVTVSFADNGDPALVDGTDGSGVDAATLSAPQTRTTSGTASGTVKDNVGNESDAGSLAVLVDAAKPAIANTVTGCPPGTVTVGQQVSVGWTAGDTGSGIKSGASGTQSHTSTQPGQQTVELAAGAAEDNVGHTSDARTLCTYTAVYDFSGFLAPINGSALNAGKTGRTYPVKWQLRTAAGSLISDAAAQSLVAGMRYSQGKVGTCASSSLVDPIDAETSGSTVLRYDEAADQFVLNYKAPTTAGCYPLGISAIDGVTTRILTFSLTK